MTLTNNIIVYTLKADKIEEISSKKFRFFCDN